MTKKSLANNLATKTDIAKLTKSISQHRSESRSTKKSLWKEILKVEGRVENFEDGQKRIETKVERLETKVDKLDERTIKMDRTLNHLRNTLDGFVGKIDNLVKDNEVGADQYREHDLKINDHEARLATLESLTQ